MTLPHPREHSLFFGHKSAEETVREAWTHRFPHAWLLCGPRGIGKATFAWRVARFVLSQEDVVSSGISARQIACGSHPNLVELCPVWDEKKKEFKNSISIEEVRRVKHFFSLRAGSKGWRVCIVDSVDEMTPHAANALLKLLEEPPPDSLFLVVCHRPGLLLTTIRSRCRLLRMGRLSFGEIVEVLKAHLPELTAEERERVASLCGGNPADALHMAMNRDTDIHEDIRALLKNFSRQKAQEVAARLGQKKEAYVVFTRFVSEWIAQKTREADLAQFPYWWRLWREIQEIFRDVQILNLSRKNSVLCTLFLLSHTRG